MTGGGPPKKQKKVKIIEGRFLTRSQTRNHKKSKKKSFLLLFLNYFDHVSCCADGSRGYFIEFSLNLVSSLVTLKKRKRRAGNCCCAEP